MAETEIVERVGRANSGFNNFSKKFSGRLIKSRLAPLLWNYHGGKTYNGNKRWKRSVYSITAHVLSVNNEGGLGMYFLSKEQAGFITVTEIF